MAKATAACICKFCGTNFTKEKICCNRKAADSWEEWAAGYYTECPECYSKRKAEEEKAKGLTGNIVIDENKSLEDKTTTYIIVTGGDSYPHKDELKALGYIFTDIYSETGYGNKKRWCKWSTNNSIKKDMVEFKNIGGTIESNPTKEQLYSIYKKIEGNK